MARKTSGYAGDVRFVNYELPKDERAKFKKWAHEQLDQFWPMLDKLLDGGYALSVKHDDFNDCISAFLLPQGDEHAHKGFVLSGRGSSAVGAAMGVLFRHFIIFEEHWPVDKERHIALDDD
jgi:hypothetical protein